jgi:hypothetical protein
MGRRGPKKAAPFPLTWVSLRDLCVLCDSR